MEIMNEVKVTINVNGQQVTATVAPEESLLDFLRNRAGATEVKCGCNKGDCGTCTVVLDGQTVKSCLVLAAQADNKQVLTVKGRKGTINAGFTGELANHGAAVRFCTPGMLVTAKTS